MENNSEREVNITRYRVLDAQRKELEQQRKDILTQMYNTGMVKCWDCDEVCGMYGIEVGSLAYHRMTVHGRQPFNFEAAIKEMDENQ